MSLYLRGTGITNTSMILLGSLLRTLTNLQEFKLWYKRNLVISVFEDIHFMEKDEEKSRNGYLILNRKK